MTLRGTVLAGSVIGAVATGAAPVATAAPTVPAPSTGSAHAAAEPTGGTLLPLVDLAAQRLTLADKVAAAKYGTDKPIDDPDREQQVLNEVAQLATDNGVDPAVAVQFFKDQIEASKDVQRELHSRWDAHPEQRPDERPDLGEEVRPELDRITGEVVRQLQETEDARAPGARCRVELVGSVLAAELHHRLDALHRQALDEAVTSVCR